MLFDYLHCDTLVTALLQSNKLIKVAQRKLSADLGLGNTVLSPGSHLYLSFGLFP